MQSRTFGPWTPAVLAGLVLVAVVGASAFGGSGSHGQTVVAGDESSSVVAGSAGSAGEALASTTVASTLPPVTSPPVEYTALTRTITDGMTGDDVRSIQQRLKDLKFDPGPVDGVFGLQTIQSVWAYKKLVLQTPADSVDGSVTPDLWDTMQRPMLVYPRRTELTSTHVEVYLDEQVLVLFTDNQPELITHVSTGSGEHWCAEVTIDPGEDGNESGTEPLKKGICGISKTTGGQFTITRKFKDDDGDGWREGQLGRMYKPVYWNYGLAIHGSSNVPKKPASHGCVRIPMHIAEYFPDLVHKGDAVYVWDGEREPEDWGRQKPVFDFPDPDYTTTTAVPTSAPTTTKPGSPTTTKAPNSSSTSSTAAPNSSSSSSSSTSSSSTSSSSTSSTAAPPGGQGQVP